MNRRRWLATTLAVVMLTITAWYAWSPIAIWYHKQGILLADRKLQAISEAQSVGAAIGAGNQSTWHARRVHHCDRLVALGYFFRESYQMDNLPCNSLRLQCVILFNGMKTFPPALDTHYWSIGANDGHFVINVYDRPTFRSQWESFAQKNNDPSIMDQYGDYFRAHPEHFGGDAEPSDARANWKWLDDERVGILPE